MGFPRKPMNTEPPSSHRRPRTLALGLVDALGERIRGGVLAPGDKLPTEAAVMEQFGVSRTVVREAISKLQAAGLVDTRHGVGTFVLGAAPQPGYRFEPEKSGTLRDVVAVLELRIGIETEAAGLAAQRRTGRDLAALREALDGFEQAVRAGRDAVPQDYEFHLGIARATRNPHFARMIGSLGTMIIPRARARSDESRAERRAYLLKVNAEHESILGAIAAEDADGARAAMRTHLANSRERRRREAAMIAGGANA
jgi:GntR family transcriptional regulator, transcriptional repressor for pyruvate dehydrogenase complex